MSQIREHGKYLAEFIVQNAGVAVLASSDLFSCRPLLSQIVDVAAGAESSCRMPIVRLPVAHSGCRVSREAKKSGSTAQFVPEH